MGPQDTWNGIDLCTQSWGNCNTGSSKQEI